jgi:hypothetical protein
MIDYITDLIYQEYNSIICLHTHKIGYDNTGCLCITFNTKSDAEDCYVVNVDDIRHFKLSSIFSTDEALLPHL